VDAHGLMPSEAPVKSWLCTPA